MPRVFIDIEDEDLAYFDACARIRDVHLRSLIRRVLKTIATDQLVAGVLDDEEHLRRREKGEHRYKNTGR